MHIVILFESYNICLVLDVEITFLAICFTLPRILHASLTNGWTSLLLCVGTNQIISHLMTWPPCVQVKRKKAKHAGMFDIAKTANRPMIHIGGWGILLSTCIHFYYNDYWLCNGLFTDMTRLIFEIIYSLYYIAPSLVALMHDLHGQFGGSQTLVAKFSVPFMF